MRSESLLSARTANLSLFGCYVYTSGAFPEGTKVSLRILHGGASFAAFGKVVYSKPNSGMGIAFTEIERNSGEVAGEPENRVVRTAFPGRSGVTVLFLRHLFSRKPSCSCTCFGTAGCCWAGQ